MDLSVIIVNWNTKDLTLRAIDSVAKSGSKLSYEIIVVDNASSDDSVQAIKRLNTTKEKIKLIQNKDNLGFAKANNIGIKEAKGQYILLLNSDTEVRKGSIDTLYNFAKGKENVGIVLPKLVNTDGSVQGSVFRSPGILRAIKQYWFGEEGILDKYSPSEVTPTEVEAGVMAAFLITPKALKLGVLNEKYFMYYEDLDYCRKVRKAGLGIYFVPDAVVEHKHGGSGKSSSTQMERLVAASKIYHGLSNYYFLTAVIWSSQKLKGLLVPLLITFLCLPAVWQLLKPGFFPMQDDLQAFRVQQMDKCFDDAQVPCRWVPDAGYQYGYPQFNYYPPLPYYIGAAMHRVGIQYIDVVKILFIAGYVASALALYLLVKELLGKFPGFIAALAYTYIPYKAVEVYVRGALSEFWAQIFFPLILWGIYMLITKGKTKYIVLLGISIAALATTHLLMTTIFVPIAVLWALYWLFRYRFKHAKKLVLAGILGFSLSAYFVIPVMFERQFVHLESVLSGYFDYRAHFVSLRKLFLSMEWGYGSSGFPDEKLNLSTGLIHSIVALVIAPVLAVITYKKSKKTSVLVFGLVIATLLVLFMIHMKSSFIWAGLPFLWFLQFPWRFLALSIFLLCMLSGYVIYMLPKYKYLFGVGFVSIVYFLYLQFFVPLKWLDITDADKFSGVSWEKQLTISIFDYLPIYATLPPTVKAPEVPEVLEGKAEFTRYIKGSDYQIGRVKVEKDALLRLPLYDFPGMVVSVDGQKVVHKHDDCRGQDFCYGLINFEISKGDHDIHVELTDTPPRALGNAITLGGLALLGLLIVQSKKHDKEAF